MIRRLLVVLLFATAVNAAHAQNPTHSDSSTPRVVIRKLAESVYPSLAQEARISGTVQVVVRVSSNGAVESIDVVNGHPILSHAAAELARKTEFECFRCTASETRTIRYVFTFESKGPALVETETEAVVTIVGTHPTIYAENLDPAYAFTRRSPKCLWLWRCGRR